MFDASCACGTGWMAAVEEGAVREERQEVAKLDPRCRDGCTSGGIARRRLELVDAPELVGCHGNVAAANLHNVVGQGSNRHQVHRTAILHDAELASRLSADIHLIQCRRSGRIGCAGQWHRRRAERRNSERCCQHIGIGELVPQLQLYSPAPIAEATPALIAGAQLTAGRTAPVAAHSGVLLY